MWHPQKGKEGKFDRRVLYSLVETVVVDLSNDDGEGSVLRGKRLMFSATKQTAEYVLYNTKFSYIIMK